MKPVFQDKVLAWGLLVFILMTFYFHFLTEQAWFPFLDSANLAFHEAGHLFVGLASDRLNVYGGTFLQLAIPIYIYLRFKRSAQMLASWWVMIWIAQNLLNVARYLGDARTQLLPLVGGGMHDWTEILSRWGVLVWDTKIAFLIKLIALFLMARVLWLLFNIFLHDHWHSMHNKTIDGE